MHDGSPSILLVGCGKMGGALIDGWSRQGLTDIVVVRKSGRAITGLESRIRVYRSAAELPPEYSPNVIVFAIKPQNFDASFGQSFVPFCQHDVAVVSIMAGKSTQTLSQVLGTDSVVRAMPNTPSMIGFGFTCAFAAAGVTALQKVQCDLLLRAVGEVQWLKSEAQIDSATAISGGGPAYVFLLTELLEAAAIGQGFSAEIARRIARATIVGAGRLLEASNEDADKLRQDVTSPQGTTERALNILMAPDAWPSLILQAISVAAERSRELGEG